MALPAALDRPRPAQATTRFTTGVWTPDLGRHGKPHYRAIADSLAEDIRSGRLPPGERLPSHRLLAELLDIDFTTVARGYQEAQRRGLIESRIGQGSFIRAVPNNERSPTRPDLVDFSMNLPPEPDDPALLARMRAGLVALGTDLVPLLRYQGFGGAPEDRDAAIRWLARRGLATTADRLLVCPGAHSALQAIMASLARPGDVLCTEDLTYPGARALAAQQGLMLVGLPMDEAGIDAEAFEAACVRHAPKALYLNPTMLNPTTVTIPTGRREAIVAVARRHGVAIIEDDAYGFIPEAGPPAFATLAPDLTYYVAGLAKCLGAGLRVAYLVAPDQRRAWPLASALRVATVMASPLTAALATRWIDDGTADALLGFIRAESKARQRLAAELLPAGSYTADPEGFHVWVRLPPPWRRSNLTALMRTSGIGVVVADAFAVTDDVPEAVRVCLGGTADRATTRRALDFLAHALVEAPDVAQAII